MRKHNMPLIGDAPVKVSLLALALGGFGIGALEFLALGLLPELAQGLLPEAHQASNEQALSKASWLVSAYALGVVIGAPTLGTMAARWPRRATLVGLLSFAAFTTFASAVGPTFEFVLVSRFLSALPHGAYFGIASIVASNLLGPDKRAGAIAFVLSGLTAATVVGVPVITWVGHAAGWRSAFTVVAGVFALSAVAVALLIPEQQGTREGQSGPGWTLFGSSVTWVALGTGAIGFGGFFAIYSYIAPMTTELGRLSESWVPVSLAVIGSGMFLGNLAGGWLSDRSVKMSLYSGFGTLLVSLALLSLLGHNPVGFLIGLFLVGLAAMSLSPTMQARLLDVMADRPSLAGAMNQSAINLGNGLGAFLGGLSVAAGVGLTAPIWVGIGLTLAGLALTMAGYRLESRQKGKDTRTTKLDSKALNRA
jgi:DHA1 family inner membrane transport protein